MSSAVGVKRLERRLREGAGGDDADAEGRLRVQRVPCGNTRMSSPIQWACSLRRTKRRFISASTPRSAADQRSRVGSKACPIMSRGFWSTASGTGPDTGWPSSTASRSARYSSGSGRRPITFRKSRVIR